MTQRNPKPEPGHALEIRLRPPNVLRFRWGPPSSPPRPYYSPTPQTPNPKQETHACVARLKQSKHYGLWLVLSQAVTMTKHTYTPNANACTHIYTHVCVYITCICIFICMHACMHACMHVCMHTHICAHIILLCKYI